MRDRPLLVFCLDAADPDALQEWAAEGRLPALRAVMDRGWWARTGGRELSLEHGAWVSLISGVSRGVHGYHYFRQLRTGSYDLHLVQGHEVGVRPFWAHADPARTRVVVVDVPDTRPIPGLRGVQLAEWAVHNPEGAPMAWPRSALAEAERVFGPQDPIPERLRSTEGEDLAIRERLLARVARKGRLIRHFISEETPTLIVVGFGEAHTGGHQFWRYRRGHAEGMAGGPLTHAIRELYEAIDRELSGVIEAVGESNVVVLSSVGMRDQFPMTGVSEAFFRQLGYQAAPVRPGAGGARPLDLARRLLPESARVALSRFLSRERREGLVADRFRTGTDWTRTTAFAVPSVYATMVRVNLKGREPQGTVEPGAAYDALLRRIETDARALTDPETGEPVVERVERTHEAFGPGATPDLPDLFIHWRPIPRFLRRVAHPRVVLEQNEPEFFRGSDHTTQGFIAASGPAFAARGRVSEVDAIDVAPTLWAALGEPPHPAFAGVACGVRGAEPLTGEA